MHAVDVSSLSAEIHTWYINGNLKRRERHGLSALPSTLSSTIPRISNFYPNIKALVTVLPLALLRGLLVGSRELKLH